MTLSNKKKIALACIVLTVAAALLLTPRTRTNAADHGDSPLTAHDQASDLNDCYIFLDPNDNSRVFLGMTMHGFIVPSEAGNFGIFDPSIRYRFEIENTGDARPDQFIDVRFSPRIAANGAPQPQTATVTMPSGQTFTAPATNPSATSDTSPTQVITSAPNGIQFFAGLVDDPFIFDITGFNRFTASVRAGTPNPALLQRGRDSFAGYNTLAIAISLPAAQLRNNGNQLGLSVATQRRTPQVYTKAGETTGFGRWINVDRTGVPAVNVALVPFNRKNEYNASNTVEDASGRFADGIVATLKALGTDDTSIAIFASLAVARGDILRVDLTKPNTGAGGGTNPEAAFPNGRRLVDDVIDTELFLINNRRPLSDNANANDVPFRNDFPFFGASQQPRMPGVTDDNTRN
ncbi:MAG: DUF4331 family protein [Pyrinomonadaceae bacterium]